MLIEKHLDLLIKLVVKLVDCHLWQYGFRGWFVLASGWDCIT